MRVWRSVAVSAAVVVLAAVAGCGADEPGDRSGAADASGGGSPSTACVPRYGVNSTPSAIGEAVEGVVDEGLPDDVRCLPSVAYGNLLVPEANSSGLPARSLMVSVVEGTTREQTFALCKRITGLGYGPGGTHKIDMLSVGGDLKSGTYLSTGQKDCVQAG